MIKYIASLGGFAGTLLALGLLFPFQAGSVSQLLPNLEALPAVDIRLETVGSSRFIRFSTLSWNRGIGPLELRAGDIISGGTQRVWQRIYNDDGTFADSQVGDFVWHPTHGHFHFEGYARYTIQAAGAPGQSLSTSEKTTFCVMDTTRVNTKLPGAPKKAFYNSCGASFQGMSVGWGDKYGYQLDGQSIDVTDLLDGEYNLRIEIDPHDKLAEVSNDDNVSNVAIRLINGTVEVIGGGRGRR